MDDISKELQAMNEAEQANLAESLKEINELANEAYKAKEEAAVKEQLAKDLKNRLSQLMESAGVDKISADLCNVNGKMKASASVPKDHSDKLKLFRYLMALDNVNGKGEPVVSHAIEQLTDALLNYPTFLNMITINATSFNSWYAKEQEKHINEGNVDWKLPYISTYEYYSVGFRKKAGKK